MVYLLNGSGPPTRLLECEGALFAAFSPDASKETRTHSTVSLRRDRGGFYGMHGAAVRREVQASRTRLLRPFWMGPRSDLAWATAYGPCY